MRAFGQEASTRGQQLGREAQAAGDRWSKDPGLVRVASTASRIWGLILVLVGLWFFAQVTLGYSLPAVPWGELWPVALVVLGLLVIARGMARRA
jgi:fatty acid desaturase